MIEETLRLPINSSLEHIIEEGKETEILSSKYKRWIDNISLEKWELHLEDIKDNHVKINVATLLDNQRLFFEISNKKPSDSEVKSIFEIIKQIYSDLLISKLVAFQAMIGPVTFIHHFQIYHDYDPSLNIVWPNEGYIPPDSLPKFNLRLFQNEITAKTRLIRINASVEDVDGFSKEFKKQIEGEVLKDLYNNCGTVMSLLDNVFDETYEDIENDPLYHKIYELTSVIHSKTLNDDQQYWIVVNADTYNKHKPLFDYYNNTHGKIKTYITDSWPNEDILIGAYGKDYNHMGGYFYCPYMPFIQSGEKQWLMRYSKKLITGGAKSYARIQRVKELSSVAQNS